MRSGNFWVYRGQTQYKWYTRAAAIVSVFYVIRRPWNDDNEKFSVNYACACGRDDGDRPIWKITWKRKKKKKEKKKDHQVIRRRNALRKEFLFCTRYYTTKTGRFFFSLPFCIPFLCTIRMCLYTLCFGYLRYTKKKSTKKIYTHINNNDNNKRNASLPPRRAGNSIKNHRRRSQFFFSCIRFFTPSETDVVSTTQKKKNVSSNTMPERLAASACERKVKKNNEKTVGLRIRNSTLHWLVLLRVGVAD